MMAKQWPIFNAHSSSFASINDECKNLRCIHVSFKVDTPDHYHVHVAVRKCYGPQPKVKERIEPVDMTVQELVSMLDEEMQNAKGPFQVICHHFNLDVISSMYVEIGDKFHPRRCATDADLRSAHLDSIKAWVHAHVHIRRDLPIWQTGRLEKVLSIL
jgi:uncharacterized protein (UPF0179 family)